MHLIVFGATGPTGRQLVRDALAAGHHVTAVTRRAEPYRLNSPHLQLVNADVTDHAAVDQVISTRPEAVISTIGVPYAKDPISVYSRGITNITQAMTAHRVQRLVCVSSTSVATDEAPGEALLWRKVVVPLLRNTLGRTLYDDMTRMEAVVRASTLDWTIVRPAGLFDATEPTTDYDVSPAHLPGRYTSRADLADFLLHEATQPQHTRVTVDLLTRSGLPLPLTTFLKEAFGIG